MRRKSNIILGMCRLYNPALTPTFVQHIVHMQYNNKYNCHKIAIFRLRCYEGIPGKGRSNFAFDSPPSTGSLLSQHDRN